MKVAQLMKPEAKSCAARDSLKAAARIMWDDDCGFVPVIDQDRKVVGVLTDRDICMAAYTQGLPLHAMQVESAMARTVVSCTSEDDVSAAEKLMQENQVRRLPIVDADGKLCGVLSLTDIVRQAQRQPTGGNGELSSGEIAKTLAFLSRPRSHATAQVTFAPEAGELEFAPSPPAKRGHGYR